MSNFIHEFWRVHGGRWDNRLTVRFPPEPNGYLHIGHVKALLANSDLVEAFSGTLLLRMDDTNPEAEKAEYETAIVEDIRWLGVPFEPTIHYASDHFPSLRLLAMRMVEAGEAYIDTSPREDLARMRGDFVSPGTPSADRERPLDWHRGMLGKLLDGKMATGGAVLRARMDLASPNMVLRDPVLWRMMDHAHPRLPGWASFPTYDFAHPFCDLRDGVALSLCSLEFEAHKPLYNHVVERAIAHGFGLGLAAPEELEFSRFEPDIGMTSKRVLKAAVESGEMDGWDDPRLLTLRGLRNKGYTADMIKRFVRRGGVGRANSTIPMGWLDEEVREAAGTGALGAVVRDPVALTLEGVLPPSIKLPDGREIAPARECVVNRDDVRAASEPGFRRLCPGATVRLMGWGGFVEVLSVRATHGHIDEVLGCYRTEGKSKATVHALPAAACTRAEMVTTRTWDGEADPTACETREVLAIEHGVEALEGVFHAPRVGWLCRADATTWRLLAEMTVRPANAPATPVHRSELPGRRPGA